MDGKTWDWHNVVDVSPFLLYESTGDSEANSDLNLVNLEAKNYEADDALSCCSDSFDSNKDYNDRDQVRAQCSKKKSKKKRECYTKFLKKKWKKKEHADGYVNPNYRYSNVVDDDEDDGAIDQVWGSCGKMGYVVSRQENNKNIMKSNNNAFGKSTMEPKEENDKVFWETCLGS